MKHVTILGAGPAGLSVALAADQAGYEIDIIAEGTKSVIDGAQWLQRPLPGLTDDVEPTMITYAKVGSVDGYAQKAYGEPEAQVSWDAFVTGDRPGWPLRTAYNQLWARYQPRITKTKLEISEIEKLVRDRGEEGEAVFCSIPLKAICRDPIAHSFEAQPVMFTKEDFIRIPNMIVYNGREQDPWYRTSCLFGACSTEYAIHNGKVPVYQKLGTRLGVKPIRNDCHCWSSYPNLIRIGRFGQWRRGVLIDHAYFNAKDIL